MDDIGKYRTLSGLSTAVYKEKGSKFIAHAIPCKTEEEAKTQIEKLRKDHPQAVHVCFAWRFGSEKYVDRFSDDGEPNNSAGKPIFGQIISHELTNVLIAVVRYYGGTNLGVGGLIQAYKTSAAEALSSADIVVRTISNYYRISFEVGETGKIMTLLTKCGANILQQGFDNNLSTINFKLPISKADQLASLISQHAKLDLTLLETEE